MEIYYKVVVRDIDEQGNIFSEITADGDRTVQSFLMHMGEIHKAGYTFEGFEWEVSLEEVDPSLTLNQVIELLRLEKEGMYYNIYINPIWQSLNRIDAVIFNGKEYGFNANTQGLAKVAKSNRYEDLDGLPDIPEVGDGKVTINQNGSKRGEFTLNGSSDVSIELDEALGMFKNVSDLKYIKGYLRTFVADGELYTLKYEKGKLKEINGGGLRRVMQYSGKKLKSASFIQ